MTVDPLAKRRRLQRLDRQAGWNGGVTIPNLGSITPLPIAT